LNGFHPSGEFGQKRLAFDPRDGHLARHRPAAGVLLDEAYRRTKRVRTVIEHGLDRKAGIHFSGPCT
jgi:hypothetical protein